MANRSFFLVTLFATLVGIGLAELVQSAPPRGFGGARSTQVELCIAAGIGCSSASFGRF
ncbi:hypothetical protein [Prosthecomicrobium pneumaticum]|uniref:Uncharacterized protein n=1 Tax=Prosthecomicrobium pneumaticum TaxID=81895 RepID=A0A7W9FM83_9HYPH|nr:hypothetical protein [Prosthecomicrobium pneumaticum]MBB5753267.1 hypothetical protein [Prosthecomicrobium pneumaticum]